MTIKFIHLRCRHPLYGTLESKGGITVAYDIESGEVMYSCAFCSPKDHYNKKIGRLVSTGRLEKGVGTQFVFTKVEGVNVVEQIIKHHDAWLAEQ